MDKIIDKNERIRDIIVYFSSKTEYLSEIRLMKLFYVAELYNAEKYGRRLTDTIFTKYHYGVFSQHIRNVLNEIEGSDVLIEIKPIPDGGDAGFIKPISREIFIGLSEEEISILEDVKNDWKYKSTNELIAFTKSTAPYQRARFGEVLDMDDYIREMNLIYHDSELIEAVKRSQKQVKEGKGKRFTTREELEKYYDSL